MKPTWGIRKLNEYSVDKNTAIIITDSEKDNYYWADIPDGSLLVNDKTGNLSIKLTGESDWVPMGIRKDGTEKLVKDAVINVEYYTIVKFELEHNRFYYHDREEITRIGKIINGKAQFKVGSGLYLPGTNQLEVLINDSVHRNTIDGGLEEINMKYFQIDADDIRLGSTVTVRYINYERLSELYPFIYTQEQVPWFFEDKDLWINPSNNIDINGLTITPLSYYVKYLDNNEAEVIVFTTKNSRLIVSRKMNEYINKITDKNVNRFKVTRENNNFYINLFSTYPGYKTSFAKVLIKGLISDEDKLTLDVDLTYPNVGIAKISAKTQLGNIVTFKRNNKKIYSAQNIGIGIQHTLAREENNYDIVVSVKNPANGLIKEKTLTIKKKMINLTANVSHVTSVNGTTISVETIPESKISVIPVNEFGVEGTPIIPETVVDANGRFSGTISLTNSGAHYKVIVTNEKADNTIEENIEVLLHNPRTPLSVNIVDVYDGLDESLKGRKGISIQAESGSTIVIKDQSDNTVFTHTPSNLSVEDIQYNIPMFYVPKTKTFTIEAIKINKVPESKTVTVQGYEKVDAPIKFQVKDFEYESSSLTRPRNTIDTRFIIEAGSTVIVYDSQNNIVNNSNGEQHSYYNNSINSFAQYNNPNYSFIERNFDQTFRFVCSHPLYKDQEVVKILEGRHLPEYTIEVKDAFVINPYADMYNSSAYQVLALKVKHNKEDLSYESLIKDFTFEYNNKIVNSINDVIIDNNIFFGGKESYKYFYDTDDLSNIETLVPNNKLENYINNSYCINLPGETILNLLVFKIDNFDDVLHDRTINIKVNGKATNDITIPIRIFHWKNISELKEKQHRITKEEMSNDLKKVHEDFSYYEFIYNSVLDNIYYIHPIIQKSLDFYNSGYNVTYLRDSDNMTIKIDYGQIEKLKKIINLPEFEYYQKYKNLRENDADISKGFREFKLNNLLLIPTQVINPSIALAYNLSYGSNLSYADNKYYYQQDYLIFNLLENKNKDIFIKNKIDSIFYDNENTNVIKDKLNISKLNYINKLLHHTCFMLPNETIDSNVLISKEFPSVLNILYLPNLIELKNFNFCYGDNNRIFIDPSKIKKFGSFPFSRDGDKYIGNIIKLIKKEPFIIGDVNFINKDYSNTLINPEEFTYKINDIGTFTCNPGSDKFDVKIVGDLVAINLSMFVCAATMENLNIDCNLLTLLNEDGNPINKNNLSGKYVDLHSNNIRTNFDLVNNKTHPAFENANEKYIEIDKFSGSTYKINYTNNNFLFFRCLSLKSIDLSKISNLYLFEGSFTIDSKLFHNDIFNITLPKKYCILVDKIDNSSIFVGNFGNTYDAKAKIRINNIDNLLCYNHDSKFKLFSKIDSTDTNINLNYFNIIFYYFFDNTSSIVNINSHDNAVSNDHLGNILSKNKLSDNAIALHIKQNGFHSFTALEGSKMQDIFDKTIAIDQEGINYLEDLTSDTLEIKENFKYLGARAFRTYSYSSIIFKNNKIKILSSAFQLYRGLYKKIIIDSTSLIVMSYIWPNKVGMDNINEYDNYKINAPNLEYINYVDSLYSTKHSIDVLSNPNIKYSIYTDVSNHSKEVGKLSIWLPYPKTMAGYYLNDLAGTSSKKKYSLLNETETLDAMNKEEVTINASPSLFFIFDPDVFDKNTCKIKKIKINIYHINKQYIDRYENDLVDAITSGEDTINYTNLANDVIEGLRWPALEEIIIHDPNVKQDRERIALGVKIKYVQA